MNEKEVFHSIAAGNKLTFDVEIDGVYDEVAYKGKFVIKYSNVKDTINIKLEEARLRGSMSEENLDKFAQFLIEGLATLKATTVEKPEWAKDMDILPTQLVLDVYTGYVEKVQSFRDRGYRKDTTDPPVTDSETTVNNS